MGCNCHAIDEEPYVELENLAPFVATRISQLPHDYIMLGLRQALIEFARKTSLITRTYRINYQQDVKDYFLIPPEGYIIHQILRVSAGDCCVYRQASPNYWFCCGYGFAYAPNKIVFAQAPSRDQEDAVRVTVALLPKDCVDTLPESIAVPYGMGIAARVLEEAHSMMGKTWYSPLEAKKAQQQFARTVQAGKALAWTNHTPGTMHLRRRRWV